MQPNNAINHPPDPLGEVRKGSLREVWERLRLIGIASTSANSFCTPSLSLNDARCC